MSFDIKYNANGDVISKNPASEQIRPVQDSVPTPDLEVSQQDQDQSSPVLTDLADSSPAVEEQIVESPVEEDIYVKNYRAIRSKAEKLERERDEAVRRLQEIESNRYAQSKAQVESPQVEEDVRVGDDDLVEGKHLTKVGRKIKALEEKIQQYQQQSSMTATEAKLKSQYSDFDKVVSRDNIEMLKDAYPELYSTIYTSSDLYNKAVSAYTLIKKLGIHREDNFASDRAMVQKNASKPRAVASIAPQQGDSPLSKANAFANGLTPELKAQLLREMQETRKDF